MRIAGLVKFVGPGEKEGALSHGKKGPLPTSPFSNAIVEFQDGNSLGISQNLMPKVTSLDDAQTALDKLHGNWTVDNVEEALGMLREQERGPIVIGLFDAGVPADVLRAAVEW